jgi:hypothetical protein
MWRMRRREVFGCVSLITQYRIRGGALRSSF